MAARYGNDTYVWKSEVKVRLVIRLGLEGKFSKPELLSVFAKFVTILVLYMSRTRNILGETKRGRQLTS